MKIKVTVGELSGMGRPLLDLLNTEMSGDVGYHVARLAKRLVEEVTLVESAQIALIRKHGGTQDTTTGGWILKPDSEHYLEAMNELNKMLAEEIELDVDTVILPAQLKLRPQILLVLEKFVSVAEK